VWKDFLFICSILAAMFISVKSYGEIVHQYDYSPRSLSIKISEKKYGNINDKIFVDSLGREVCFRGWNVSGATKHVQTGFKPFLNAYDAKYSFELLKKITGANVVRFLIVWEGVNPNPDEIDYSYLDDVIEQMKCAIRYGMYVIIDYHEDLFSRHLFHKDSWFTGNGAPKWVTPDYDREDCTIGNIAGWAGNLFKNEPIRRAFRSFWNNVEIFKDSSGESRKMQDEFLLQLGKAVQYIKKKLAADEFPYILGVDPFNEPADGGLVTWADKEKKSKEFDNDKLWPFYKKVRKTLSQYRFKKKLVFAEPLVFWNTTASGYKTGGHYLVDSKPGDGYVFNSHFYDAGRMGRGTDGVNSGVYLENMKEIREEGRFLGLPVFLSEFGMWLGGIGAQDTVRTIKDVYQGIEVSSIKSQTEKYANFYTPFISSTQWHWDIYYNRHTEGMNFNKQKVLTEKDAWNNENFSVISTSADLQTYTLNMDPEVVQRGYPRYVQGRLMNFYYNDLSHDAWGKEKEPLKWACIKIDNEEHFKERNFMLLTWRGRQSNAPTEIFIPKQIIPDQLLLITDCRIYNRTLTKDTPPDNTDNEAVLISDIPGQKDAGYRLIIWDDTKEGFEDESIHFALIVAGSGVELPPNAAEGMQKNLREIIQQNRQNPLYIIP